VAYQHESGATAGLARQAKLYLRHTAVGSGSRRRVGGSALPWWPPGTPLSYRGLPSRPAGKPPSAAAQAVDPPPARLAAATARLRVAGERLAGASGRLEHQGAAWVDWNGSYQPVERIEGVRRWFFHLWAEWALLGRRDFFLFLFWLML
jgi:hypothetical protein